MKKRAQRDGHPLKFLFAKFVKAYGNGIVTALSMTPPEFGAPKGQDR